MAPRNCISRSIHVAAASATPAATTPRLHRTAVGSSSKLFHPKPHLANYHQQPLQASATPIPTPVSPRLPPRRQPAFNPGGFGLQSQPTQQSLKGKERAFSELVKDEQAKEGREEAEACYVVSKDLHRCTLTVNSHLPQRSTTTPSILFHYYTLTNPCRHSQSLTRHGVH